MEHTKPNAANEEEREKSIQNYCISSFTVFL